MIRHVDKTLAFAAALAISLGCFSQTELPTQRPDKGEKLDCTVYRIYDGDTVTADCGQHRVRIRVWGIDAPEMGQKPWGVQSRNYLRGRLSGSIKVQVLDYDRYGRAVARIYQDRKDIGLEMVSQGKAAVYEQYNDAVAYYRAECQARESRLGIWSQDGNHRRPWEWRRR